VREHAPHAHAPAPPGGGAIPTRSCGRGGSGATPPTLASITKRDQEPIEYRDPAQLHELHLCPKTLHNFRERLLNYKDAEGRPDPEKKKLAFRRVTDE
jgi:hypothetical protein